MTKKYCAICGKPSGYIYLCSEHVKLFETDEIETCSICNSWKLKSTPCICQSKYRTNYCNICGKPSGMYPLCKEHYLLINSEVVKCNACGTWHYKNIICPTCKYKPYFEYNQCIICGSETINNILCEECRTVERKLIYKLSPYETNNETIINDYNLLLQKKINNLTDLHNILINLKALAEFLNNEFNNDFLIKRYHFQNFNMLSLYNPKYNKPKIYTAKPILTNPEQEFYKKLNNVISLYNDYSIVPQSPLMSFINKNIKLGNSNNCYELNSRVDFIICNSNYKALIAIELNDKSHNEPDRIKRDIDVKKVCAGANIPLLSFWCCKPNTEEYIKKQIDKTLATL